VDSGDRGAPGAPGSRRDRPPLGRLAARDPGVHAELAVGGGEHLGGGAGPRPNRVVPPARLRRGPVVDRGVRGGSGSGGGGGARGRDRRRLRTGRWGGGGDGGDRPPAVPVGRRGRGGAVRPAPAP